MCPGWTKCQLAEGEELESNLLRVSKRSSAKPSLGRRERNWIQPARRLYSRSFRETAAEDARGDRGADTAATPSLDRPGRDLVLAWALSRCAERPCVVAAWSIAESANPGARDRAQSGLEYGRATYRL